MIVPNMKFSWSGPQVMIGQSADWGKAGARK
jgi:hypothetical protein